MSTYIDPRQPNKHGDYKDCPELVVRYLYDSETIRGLSPRTVNGYYNDLRTFFRFLMQAHGLPPAGFFVKEQPGPPHLKYLILYFCAGGF